MSDKKEKYYMSIGHHIGLCTNDKNEKFFNVEVNGDFVGLFNEDYLIWKYCFFDVKERDDIILYFVSQHIMSDFNVGIELDRLISNKCLVCLEDLSSINDTFDILKDYRPQRNGFGTGLINDNANELAMYRILNQSQSFDVITEDFTIWSLSNGKNTVEDICDKMQKDYLLANKEAKSVIINGILRLKTLDLLRINI